jgi:PAS domain S-box-containing protein
MTVSKKLSFSFGFLILVLVINGVLSVSRIRHVESVMARIGHSKKPQLLNLSSIQTTIYNLHISVLRYFRTGDEFFLEEAEFLLPGLSENINQFTINSDSDLESKISKKLEKNCSALADSAKKLLQLAVLEKKLWLELSGQYRKLRTSKAIEQKEGMILGANAYASLLVYKAQDGEDEQHLREEFVKVSEVFAGYLSAHESKTGSEFLELLNSSFNAHEDKQASFKRFQTLFEQLKGYIEGVVYPLVSARTVSGDQYTTELVGHAKFTIMFLVCLGIFGGFVAAYALRTSIIKPIQLLKEGVERFAVGNLSYRLSFDRNDEVGELGSTFDYMAENLEEAYQEITLLKEVVEQSPVSVLVTDVHGKIQYASPQFAQFAGYKKSKLPGMNAKDFVSDWDLVMEALKNQDKLFLEFSETNKDNEQQWLELVVFRLNDEEENVTNYVRFSRDITSEKILEKERRKFEEQLSQSKKLETIGRLAGGVAHDFNNILTSMMGYTEICLLDADPESQMDENLHEVLVAGRRGRELVKQILTFSRQRQQALSEMEIELIIKEALKSLKPNIPKNIKVIDTLEAKGVLINGDPTNIHQVVFNLCNNASQAIGDSKGSIEITLRVVNEKQVGVIQSLSQNEYVELKITDSGPGISNEVLEKIFDPFFTTKVVGKGTGLGLSVVHGIVKNHRGEIFVDSVVGEGTSFQMLFPLVGMGDS